VLANLNKHFAPAFAFAVVAAADFIMSNNNTQIKSVQQTDRQTDKLTV